MRQLKSCEPPDLPLRVRPPEGVKKAWGGPALSCAPPDLPLRVRPPEGVKKAWGGPALSCRLRRGLTLIELVVTLAIGGILMSMAAPALSDFWLNHQLRAAGDTLLGEALYARTEAIKRNVPTRLVISGADLSVRDMSDGAAGVLLRQRRLADGMSATGTAQVDFDSRGILLPLGTEAATDIGKAGINCSADFRCPGLRVDGGGNMRLCADKLACT